MHVAHGSPGFVVSCGRTRGDSPLFWVGVEVGKVWSTASSLKEVCEEVQFWRKTELNNLHSWLIWIGDGEEGHW